MGGVDDEAGAARGAAAARMQVPIAESETVVEGEFGARGDVAAGNDPDTTADHLDAAVGGAGVIDEAGDIAAGAAVEIVALGEVENVNAGIAAAALAGEALELATGGLGLRDAFAGVFDRGRAVGDRLAGVDAAAVNRGLSGGDPAGDRGAWRAVRAGGFLRKGGADSHAHGIGQRVRGGKRFRGACR